MSNEEIPPPDPSSSGKEPQRQQPDQQAEPAQRFFQQRPAQGENSVVVAPALENKTYNQLFNELLESELSVELQLLSAGEYLAMILMYFIQGRAVEGRFAVLRALERYKGCPQLQATISLAETLCDNNISAALTELHNFTLVDGSFEPYIIELKDRLLARRLRQIQRAYTTINFLDFSKAIGFGEPNQTVEQILQQIQWTLSEDGQFVEPKDTESFRQLLADAPKPEFGPEKTDSSVGMKRDQNSSDVLKRLVEYATFLDRSL